MAWDRREVARGLSALREAVARLLLAEAVLPEPLLAVSAGTGPRSLSTKATTEARRHQPRAVPTATATPTWPTSSEESEAERNRLIALVELARKGDADAFGMLYDHYQASVYRFLFYRTRSSTLAEDLTSETFFRALRSMTNFRWQGKDFGAWLMTIARNLATDHFKAGRTRLEMTTEDMGQHDDATEGPESQVLASLTNEMLLNALTQLPDEQRDCLVMRFLQGMSISETAQRARAAATEPSSSSSSAAYATWRS